MQCRYLGGEVSQAQAVVAKLCTVSQLERQLNASWTHSWMVMTTRPSFHLSSHLSQKTSKHLVSVSLAPTFFWFLITVHLNSNTCTPISAQQYPYDECRIHTRPHRSQWLATRSIYPITRVASLEVYSRRRDEGDLATNESRKVLDGLGGGKLSLQFSQTTPLRWV